MWERFRIVLSVVGLLACERITTAQVSNAIAYWKFDEGSGTSALDSSTNSHIGTIVAAGYASGRLDAALSLNGSNS